jgi:murein hydrolase activator
MPNFPGMMNLRFHIGHLSGVLVFALLSGPHLAWAESGTSAGTAQELDQIEQSLKSSNEKQAAIAAEIDSAVKSQVEISEKLITLAKGLEDQQQAINKADKKITALSSEAIVIRSDLAAKQDQLSELLAGLQRLELNPPPALVVDPEDVLQALRGAMMFGAVVPAMREQAETLKAQLDRLEVIKSESETAKKNLQDANLAANSSKQELKLLQQQKKNFTITATSDLAAEKLRAETMGAQAKNLKQLLASLEAAKIEAETRKSVEAKAREEAEKLKIASMASPPLALSDQRGKLNYPVQGDIFKQFGDDNGLGSPLEGVAVATVAGQNVVSPVDGRIEFAGQFRSYGKLLILNAGEGYLVLLAGMNQISAEIGQSIRAGEPVGMMGDGPSSVALIGGDAEMARPVLYVEFRKNNEPVDPSPWWLGGRKEAMK